MGFDNDCQLGFAIDTHWYNDRGQTFLKAKRYSILTNGN